jgi:GNAT superfamily N-acetyltransferase
MSPAATYKSALPDSKSPDLHLTLATPEERLATWRLNFKSWGGALPLEGYIRREKHLMNTPLTRDGAMTHWVLVSKDEPPNDRAILGSCETIRKVALLSKNGQVTEVITYGIGSVFCDPKYRGHGYASRMMTELSQKLRTWHTAAGNQDQTDCTFTVLWSDVGKKFYAAHGWYPFPSTHMTFPVGSTEYSRAMKFRSEHLEKLCNEDIAMIKRDLTNAKDGKTHVALLPDHVTISWHHDREDFMGREFFGEIPSIKGAIIGKPGERVWATWTRTYYGPLEEAKSGNTLHILRFVIEQQDPTEEEMQELAEKVRHVLIVAKQEASSWQTGHVELWNPSPLLRDLIERTNLEHGKVERENDSIASLMWYGEGSGKVDEIEWVGNEKYGWC